MLFVRWVDIGKPYEKSERYNQQKEKAFYRLNENREKNIPVKFYSRILYTSIIYIYHDANFTLKQFSQTYEQRGHE